MRLRKGFTLFEILIVLAIIAILTNFMVVSIRGFQSEARISRAHADLKTLQVAFESYFKNNNHYPDVANYQTELLLATPRILEENMFDPFAPTTVAFYSYQLSPDQNYYVLYSIGPNKNGSAFVLNDGTQIASNGAIWVSNISQE